MKNTPTIPFQWLSHKTICKSLVRRYYEKTREKVNRKKQQHTRFEVQGNPRMANDNGKTITVKGGKTIDNHDLYFYVNGESSIEPW